ncbi:MAG: dihydroxyacetone kinase subunit DhaL [Bryobacteraceae bacterium]
MSQDIGVAELGEMFRNAAALIRERHKHLSELDCVAGDGDHGSTMLRAVEQLERAAANNPVGPRELLRDAGWNVMGVDGGASSALVGTFFAGMADVPGEGASLDSSQVVAAFECGLAAVRRQTKAQPGDKTMMDALVPAIQELSEAVAEGAGVAGALQRAVEAAQAGAEATRAMTARFGRAKYQGEKTLGHPDPGAVSIALIFEGFYRGLREPKGEVSNAGRG